MNDTLLILPQPIQPIGAPSAKRPMGTDKRPSLSFDKVLDDQVRSSTLNFSRHASERMASRGIELNQEELSRLNDAVSLVKTKGSQDSLVLLNDKALVISVKNNTVVTVVDRENLKHNVFTKIDSAVIA